MHGQGTGKRVRGNECVSRGQGYGGAPPQRVSPKEGFRTECRKGCGETVQGSRPVLPGAQALKALPRPGPGGSPATVIPAHDFCHLQYKFPSVPQKPGHWARCGGAVVKVLVLHARNPNWVLVLLPAAPLPIQLPACGPGMQSRTVQGSGTLHPHGQEGAGSLGRGSWIRIGSAPAVAAAWGVNHGTEDLPLCLSSSLYICLSNKNKSLTISFHCNTNIALHACSVELGWAQLCSIVLCRGYGAGRTVLGI